MKVDILNESGYEYALIGLSKSFKDRTIPNNEWWNDARFEKMEKTAKGICSNDGGHNKFLESMMVWIDIEAPRCWWQEFDTYRVGITKQSDSTMHTIQRRATIKDDYEEDTNELMIKLFNEILFEETDGFTNKKRLKGESLKRVKYALPEGFLQARVVCCNYKTLRNMILQRYNHAFDLWQTFIKELYKQLEHPELLPNLKNKK